MALRAFYFIRTLTKALTYYYINRSQRHLLVAIENNRFGGPIGIQNKHRIILNSALLVEFFAIGWKNLQYK